MRLEFEAFHDIHEKKPFCDDWQANPGRVAFIRSRKGFVLFYKRFKKIYSFGVTVRLMNSAITKAITAKPRPNTNALCTPRTVAWAI